MCHDGARAMACGFPLPRAEQPIRGIHGETEFSSRDRLSCRAEIHRCCAFPCQTVPSGALIAMLSDVEHSNGLQGYRGLLRRPHLAHVQRRRRAHIGRHHKRIMYIPYGACHSRQLLGSYAVCAELRVMKLTGAKARHLYTEGSIPESIL